MPKLPVVGNVDKTKLLFVGGTVVLVGGYLLYKHNKQSKAVGEYGYGASAYGYGSMASGYYGYGYGYGGFGGSGFSPYPYGSEYGYGAFGYGYYNPYTGGWIGPAPTGAGTGTGTGTGGTGTVVGTKPAIYKNYPPLPNPTLAQEQKAWAAGRAPNERGLLYVHGQWYTVPAPPATGSQTHTIRATGTMTLAATARANHISEFQLLAWNPNLAHLYGSGKPIPRGTMVKV